MFHVEQTEEQEPEPTKPGDLEAACANMDAALAALAAFLGVELCGG